ncbi:hypothetical protein [Halomonas sp. PA16-9]|uniref:hypothetical protein n=1 Tax=Halomonas sp. PA16-9 TaxID=2576841 RepID=UPI0030ED5184
MRRMALRRLRSAGGLARSLFIYWRPGRQRGLQRLYQPFIQPGTVAFDIGAHLGDRSAAFHALGAKVVALEPQPDLAKWFKRLVKPPTITLLRWRRPYGGLCRDRDQPQQPDPFHPGHRVAGADRRTQRRL